MFYLSPVIYLTGNVAFRQILYGIRSDNAANQRIAEDELSAKKIVVNAQVTFMISILEMISYNFTCLVALVFGSISLPGIINGMLIYMILLPRAFLMNTSHNKRRIIERGWKNCLRNTLGLSPTPSDPAFNPGNKVARDKMKSTFKKGRGVVHRGERGIVDSQTRHHNPNKLFHTGTASKLERTVSDAKDKKQKKPPEIMITPKSLELSDGQMYPPKIGSISDEGNNSVLRCTANPLTTSGCLGKHQILLSDLEQESEVLFGCK